MNVKSFDGTSSYHITAEEYGTFQAKCSCARDLQDHIMEFSEEELLVAIGVEKENRNRENILSRLYSRYSSVRRDRERRELMA